ncbi:MAG: hypothetical protein Q8L86_12390 [Vicinamibacterales bacterium]|nr:hypothetical protein [Vicinamibacterales bacterium]
MESFESAAKAHESFQHARQQALADLQAERDRIDERIKQVLAWGKPASLPVKDKKRGRPRKEDLQKSASVLK